MPLTLAHPVAAIPLRRLLGRYGVPSALVIGSVAPDLPYFLPIAISRDESHSLAGLVWFCLPASIAAYALFHLVLKLPLLSLSPTNVARRLAGALSAPRGLPSVPWSSVLLSLLAGAAIHITWDAFTHEGSPGVRAVAVLRAPIFSVGGYRVFAYQLLQHASTSLGLLLLGWWMLRWLQRAPARPMDPTISMVPWKRRAAVATVLGVPGYFGLASAVSSFSRPVTLTVVQLCVGRSLVSGLSALGAAILVFSLVWHLGVARGTSRASAVQANEP